MSDPFAVNEDGTAKDPVAFRDALRADPEKVKTLEQDDPELAKAVLGEDTAALQEVLKKVMTQMKKAQEFDQMYAMTSVDKMRSNCTVPRDPVMLYEGMLQVGLQYGPAFRLLTDVYVPESVANAE